MTTTVIRSNWPRARRAAIAIGQLRAIVREVERRADLMEPGLARERMAGLVTAFRERSSMLSDFIVLVNIAEQTLASVSSALTLSDS